MWHENSADDRESTFIPDGLRRWHRNVLGKECSPLVIAGSVPGVATTAAELRHVCCRPTRCDRDRTSVVRLEARE
jgi:hypothetical protein